MCDDEIIFGTSSMADNVKEIVDKITMEVNETQEAFVFKTIHEYCKGVYGMGETIILPKELISRALICFREEHYDEWEKLMDLSERKIIYENPT